MSKGSNLLRRIFRGSVQSFPDSCEDFQVGARFFPLTQTSCQGKNAGISHGCCSSPPPFLSGGKKPPPREDTLAAPAGLIENSRKRRHPRKANGMKATISCGPAEHPAARSNLRC